MTENQIELKEMIGKDWGTYTTLMPEVADLYYPLQGEAYNDGEVQSKYKRMMAIVGALVKSCPACMLYQTEKALEAGATVDEILETCAVAVALGGSMASGEISRIMRLLKEMGRIED